MKAAKFVQKTYKPNSADSAKSEASEQVRKTALLTEFIKKYIKDFELEPLPVLPATRPQFKKKKPTTTDEDPEDLMRMAEATDSMGFVLRAPKKPGGDVGDVNNPSRKVRRSYLPDLGYTNIARTRYSRRRREIDGG